MAYAGYNYYTSVYMGDTVPSNAFPKVAQRASDYINYVTQGKSTTGITGPYEENIKMATCAVAENIYSAEGQTDHIVSESVGGHSITYDKAIQDKTKYQSVKMYLASTGLLYAGVDTC